MQVRLNQLIRFLMIFPTLLLLINGTQVLWGQVTATEPVVSSGNEYRVPQRELNGNVFGQEDVLMQEVTITDMTPRYRRLEGRVFRRVDVGISGTVEAWAVKEGARGLEFTTAPDLIFTQSGNLHRRFHGTLRYEASKGMGMTIIYPKIEATWNRKLIVTVHGSGGSFTQGTMSPWNEILDSSAPLGDISNFERVMLDKGYAIAKTYRNASISGGDYTVTLDNGEVLEGRNVGKMGEMLISFAQMAQNLIEARMGEEILRTYWYGKSGGGMNGRLANYVYGVNDDGSGEPVIDGFINDDSGEGLFLPIVEENGRDTMLVTPEQRRRFVKTIEIIHMLYGDVAGSTYRRDNENLPSFVAPVRIINKRMNAKILQDKGLGDKSRSYEVRGVSHSGGEYLQTGGASPFQGGKDGDIEVLSFTRLIDGLIDVLDNWVDKGIAPPPTKSDWAELGDADGDGIIENQAIAPPEVACPLGLYYPYPPSREGGGIGTTAFAHFDGQSIEPHDGRGFFVDMNLNRYLDYREGVEQAWQRLGLLEPGESFSRSKYQACVEASVAKLQQDKFITDRIAALYIEEAAKADLPGL